jgi:UDP-galactopyranose mutase
MDLDLIAAAAASRPAWHFVMLGPVVKIDPAILPQAPNLWYLGPKAYHELPAYLGGWAVGIMPFAHNEATRYISPTKTPEYLAAGLRVVSTSIHDVVEPYQRLGLAEIGDGRIAFVDACERALRTDVRSHLAKADALLGEMSWDRTWTAIDALVTTAIERRVRPRDESLAPAPAPDASDEIAPPALTASLLGATSPLGGGTGATIGRSMAVLE